jgi:hypothetical protein
MTIQRMEHVGIVVDDLRGSPLWSLQVENVCVLALIARTCAAVS